MNYFLLILIFFIPLFSQAEINYKGTLSTELRAFHVDEDDETEDRNLGASLRLELGYQNDFGLNLKSQTFGRFGLIDTSRNRLNIEELYIVQEIKSIEVFAGYRIFNWSTSEAFRPNDIINSKNYDSQFENPEKLGEPMIGLAYYNNFFETNLFFMPLVINPQFPENTNRLSINPTGFNTEPVNFLSNSGQLVEEYDFVDQFGANFKLILSNLDINFFWANHYNRSNLLYLNTSLTDIQPLLVQVNHYGLGLTYVYDNLILKSDLVYKDFKDTITSADSLFSVQPISHGIVVINVNTTTI